MQPIYQKIKNKILALDYFNLFYDFLIYLPILFWFTPISFYLNFPSQYIKYLKNSNFSFDNGLYYLLTLLGLLSFIFGFKLIKNYKINKIEKLFQKEWDYKKAFFVYLFLFLLGAFMKLILYLNGNFTHINKNTAFSSNPFSSVIGFLSWSSYFALSLAFCLYFYFLKIGDRRYKFWQVVAWLNFTFELFLGYLTISKYLFLIPVFIYLISRHYLCKKSLMRVIIVFLFIIFVIFPLFNYRRNPSGILYYTKQVDHNLKMPPQSIIEYSIDSSLPRITNLHTIYVVIDKTENFLYGKNIKDFFISLGPPRFIWKDKPAINAGGNEFGRKYGLLAPDDFQTSIAPTVFGDWYMNFGVLGIIIGVSLQGVIVGLVYNTFIKNKNLLPANVFVYTILWINVLKEFEGFSAPTYALIVKLFVMLVLIQLVLIKNLFKSKN